MDCKEFQEVVSALVDNELEANKKLEAEAHLKKCFPCFFDYKIESFVKKIVQFRFKRATCPESLKVQITTKLATNSSKEKSTRLKILNLNKLQRMRYAFVSILILAVGIFLFNLLNNSRQSDESIFLSFIYENYIRIRNHQFPNKAIFTSSFETIKNFLFANGMTQHFLPKTDWLILGAGLEEINQTQVAHLLFKCEGIQFI